MKKLLQKREGFTLIELLIVVAIIGIIAGIAIPRFLGARTTAKVTRAFADMRTIADALEMYFIDEGKYPDSLLTDLTTKYITSIPKDPFDSADGSYRYYCDYDADTNPMATMWLLVSNGPDGSTDVTIADDADWSDFKTVSGELGGPNGVMPEEDETYYGAGPGDNGWSVAASASDDGDIGRGGP